jgi:hypothetical protein
VVVPEMLAVHHPLTAVGRQIDLFVPRHFFQKALDIRFFHITDYVAD